MKGIKLCFRISMITLQPIQSSIKNLEMSDFNRPFTSMFNVTSFENNQGLYYESYGDIRLSHLSWKLVTYLDLDTLISKYAMIMKYYEATTEICKKMTERFGSVEISNTCELFMQQFSRATLPYLNEIDANHRSLMLAIGYTHTEETRIRRGLGSAFRRVANVLYGICSKIDIEFIISRIMELNRTKVNSLNLTPEKIRISQTETNHATQQIQKQQQKLEENLQFLQQQTNNSIKNINRLEFKTRILEQVLLFEVLLNKYAYETQNLVAILNTAIDGKLHTSMFTPQKLYRELLEIKMDIPIGNALPLEVNTETLIEFYRISEITIIHKNNYLIYVMEIPLISSDEYTMYHPIPLPIQYNGNTIILIDPELDYIGFSRDNEHFLTLRLEQWEKCVQATPYKICKDIQQIHYSAASELCVISLFTNHQSSSNNCKVKFLSLHSSIWHKLSQTNSWIYYSQPEIGTITCQNSSQTSKIEISGVGRLTLSPLCKIHIGNSILFTTNRPIKNTLHDIIPDYKKNNLMKLLEESVKNVLPQNITDNILSKDLNHLVNIASDISKLPHVSSEPLLILRIEFYVITIYVFAIFFAMTISIIIYKLRINRIKTYNPEIPDSKSSISQVDIQV
ncbi:uncharacterized protein LOC132927889 [Rhopalosiphum padi]|uniref:uncharacterized protein LOC132927889 n=1 Tax=Rhopalosiphum padi TaxID=40932 RepID=UPI00298DA442|nr:uncharacterized protein LOC132927889 [Rhopalosiphum padi]